jgi:general secretion pathway protein L
MTQVLLLPADPAAPYDFDHDRQNEIVAVAPASVVRLTWIALPDLPQAQCNGAAREILSPQILGGSPLVHLVTGDRAQDSTLRPVAWVDHGWMRATIERLKSLSLNVSAIVPAGLLLPTPIDGAVRAKVGEECVVRSGESVWLDDPAINAVLGESGEIRDVSVSMQVPEAGFPLNLLTGLYAPKAEWKQGLASLRKSLLLVGAIFLVTLLIPIVSAFKNDRAAQLLEEQAFQNAKRQLPDAREPVLALAASVRAKRGGGAGFLATATVVVQSIAAVPNVELTALQFGPSGTLETTIRATSEAEALQVQRLINTKGFAANLGPKSLVQGRTTHTLRVTGQ